MCNTVTRLHVQYGNMSSCAILFVLIQPVTQSTAHLTDLQPGSSTDPFTTSSLAGGGTSQTHTISTRATADRPGRVLTSDSHT